VDKEWIETIALEVVVDGRARLFFFLLVIQPAEDGADIAHTETNNLQ
jgi:hypothetical protein